MTARQPLEGLARAPSLDEARARMPGRPALTVRFTEDPPRGRFALLDAAGAILGDMTFSRAADDLVIVDHTEVDDSLRGMGGGRVLFDAMVTWARETKTRVMATCSFVLSMFERVPESQDVRA